MSLALLTATTTTNRDEHGLFSLYPEVSGAIFFVIMRANYPVTFRSLDERRMPIISVLNLKGGVGKTTLTANLGAALSRRGWKVLLIDLELQGSLTSLFVAEQDQTILNEQRRFIGDFLAHSFDAEYPNLLSYAQPVMGSNGSALVGTVDTLVYAETNLTVRWLLREGNRDPRFILRRELHLKRISNAFDIVLLDCPPLINVCCVNALAASDSVLIPVMPSKATTDRVPVLLSRMLQFRENINGNLKVLGMVANRTFGSELTGDEKNRLSELEVKAKNVWGENVPRLESFIRQSTEVRRAEDEHRPLAKNDEMADAFGVLAREVEGRLPTFCRATRRPASIPAEVTS
jgi:cellulose biosynthesis protein BcsQ